MPPKLYGRNILITREKQQAQIFSDKVLERGGNPSVVPLLTISCKNHQDVMKPLQENTYFSWLFFTSVNGVHCFFQLLNFYNIDKAVLAESKLAAVGQKTAKALDEYGYQVDFIPSVYNAETMRNEFNYSNTHTDEHILLIKGNRSRRVLPDWFKEQGIPFEQMEVYETARNDASKDELNRQLRYNHPDIITFTSPSSVDAFMTLKETAISVNATIACIGTTTGERALDFGFRCPVVPNEFTIDGMLDQIGQYIEQKGWMDDE
ncbi:uroporphyrinogen-III synthase [Lentibacillus halophilus]